jgi:hypothetical protein
MKRHLMPDFAVLPMAVARAASKALASEAGPDNRGDEAREIAFFYNLP